MNEFKNKYCSECVNQVIPGEEMIRHTHSENECHLCGENITSCIKCTNELYPKDDWKKFSDEFPERHRMTLIYGETPKSFSLKFDVMWDILETGGAHKHIGTHWQYVEAP